MRERERQDAEKAAVNVKRQVRMGHIPRPEKVEATVKKPAAKKPAAKKPAAKKTS